MSECPVKNSILKIEYFQYLCVSMKRTLDFNPFFVLLMAMLLAPGISYSQDYMVMGDEDDTSGLETNLLVEAQVLKNGGPFEGVIIEVVDDKRRVVITDTTKSNGYFSIKLGFDSLYTINFKKDGFVTKRVEVDTRNMIEDDKAFGYDLGLFKISMLKKEPSTDYSIYRKPVARFKYSETAQIFVVDKKFKKEVKKRFEEKDQNPEIIKF